MIHAPRSAPPCLAAAVAYACGPRTAFHGSGTGPTSTPPTRPAVAAALDVNVQGRVRFALRVTNNAAKRLELTFPSGQTHDFVVIDRRGTWSGVGAKGACSRRPCRTECSTSDETPVLRGELDPRRRCTVMFVAVASLRSENHPVEQRVQFTLP